MQKDNLTNQQRKLMSEIKDYDTLLSVLEVMLVDQIRDINYGSITIFINDGVPQRTKLEISKILTPALFNKK